MDDFGVVTVNPLIQEQNLEGSHQADFIAYYGEIDPSATIKYDLDYSINISFVITATADAAVNSTLTESIADTFLIQPPISLNQIAETYTALKGQVTELAFMFANPLALEDGDLDLADLKITLDLGDDLSKANIVSLASVQLEK